MATGNNRARVAAARGGQSSEGAQAGSRISTWSGTVKTVAGLVLTGAGALGFWLSPLKEYSLRLIYPENAQLTLTVERTEVRPGDLIVFEVSVTPRSKVDVVPGELRIAYETSAFESIGGETAVNTEGFGSTRKVDQGKFRFKVRQVAKPATAKVSATLTTRYGSYVSNVAIIKITPITIDGEGPTIRRGDGQSVDLTGTWSLEIGAVLGGMKIKQDNSDKISGEYFLRDNFYGDTGGKIEGFKDGSSLKVFFVDSNGKKSSVIRIDSNFHINEKDSSSIEIIGCAYMLKPDKTVKTDDLIDKILPCKSRSYVNYRGTGASNFTAYSRIQ